MTKEEIIVENYGLIKHVALNFINTGIEVDELVSIGSIGMMKAIESFSPSRNVKFSTFASKCITNEILMYLRKNKSRFVTISLQEILIENNDGDKLNLEDVVGTDPEMVNDSAVANIQISQVLDAVNNLSERDRFIIEHTFELNNKPLLTQREIGEKLNLSQSYITRLIRKITWELRHTLNERGAI